jgi:hypothetical protein
MRTIDRGRAVLFALLLGLFVFRVVAQLWQAFSPTALLPPFGAWQSGTLPYAALFASQVAIIAFCLWFLRAMVRGSLEPRKALGRTLAWLGGAYLAGSAFRLVAGLTFLAHLTFFAAILPAIFHLVLASMVLVAADFHLRGQAS